MPKDDKRIMVRIDPTTHKQIAKLAKEQHRSTTQQINKMLIEALDLELKK